MEYLNAIEYWHWLILGIVLLGLEILVFGAVFLWMGLAALFVGILVFLIPTLLWMPQILIWSVIAVAGALGWQAYRRKNPAKDNAKGMNRRGEQYIGRHFTLTSDVVNGVGDLRVDDTRWKIVSNHDLPAGAKVKVTGVEGTSLRVEEFIS